MKYETIGGSIHDTSYHHSTIRELKVGDKFTIKSSKHKYSVVGERCLFNPNGQSVRKCLNINTSSIEFKRCNTHVIKLH